MFTFMNRNVKEIQHYIFYLFSVSTNDYNTAMMPQNLVFDSCDTRNCVGIEIVNDTTVEATESFIISLDSLHERVRANPEVAVINIEGKGTTYITFCIEIMTQWNS